MAALIAGRTASAMPGLDIAEQKSWQSFLDSTLRLYAALNRQLTEVHQLSLPDVRVLDMLDNAATGSARMGDLAEALPSLPISMANVLEPLKTTQRMRLTGESVMEAGSMETGYAVSGLQVLTLDVH